MIWYLNFYSFWLSTIKLLLHKHSVGGSENRVAHYIANMGLEKANPLMLGMNYPNGIYDRVIRGVNIQKKKLEGLMGWV